MLLFIDTSDYNGLHFALVESEASGSEKTPARSQTVKEFRRELAFNENYKTLELLEKFLRGNKTAPAQLETIIVCSGPGSFTGIRVGIAMAQAFGLALGIPVTAVSKNKIPKNLGRLWEIKGSKKLALNYGREPNITMPPKPGDPAKKPVKKKKA